MSPPNAFGQLSNESPNLLPIRFPTRSKKKGHNSVFNTIQQIILFIPKIFQMMTRAGNQDLILKYGKSKIKKQSQSQSQNQSESQSQSQNQSENQSQSQNQSESQSQNQNRSENQNQRSESKIRIKDQNQSSASKIRIKDQNQRSESKIRIKTKESRPKNQDQSIKLKDRDQSNIFGTTQNNDAASIQPSKSRPLKSLETYRCSFSLDPRRRQSKALDAEMIADIMTKAFARLHGRFVEIWVNII
jgi:DNA mismatch repair ATPase MutL